MVIGNIIRLIILLVGVVLLFRLLWEGVIAYRRAKHPSSRNTLLLYFSILICIIVVPIWICTQFAPKVSLNTITEKENYYKTFDLRLSLHDLYYKALQKDSTNVDLNYKMLDSYKHYVSGLDKNRPPHIERLRTERWLRIEKFYQNLITHSENNEVKQQGEIFLALHYGNSHNPTRAKMTIDQVTLDTLPYYNLAMGTALVFSKRKSEFTNAKKHLYQSIDDSIGIRQAYNNLAYLYYYFRAEDQLQELVFEPKAEAFLNGFYKRIVFYRANLWHMYFGHIWSSRLSNISLWAFIGALSILLVWFFYLRRLDVFEPEKWHHVLIILGMSMTTIWLVYPMGDFLRDTLELYPSSDPLIDFVYMVISIGIPEELVKIIPVLIMLRFTKAINEPFDYILYCSISALGFAFIENLGYIRYDSLYNIDARTLMAALGHIGFTSIIGYGLILHRYNRIGNGFVMFIISFVLAAATHAFYDFWLLHEGLYYYDWVTLVFVLIGAHVWHIMANNALNISVFYNPQVVFKRNETKFYIIIGLTAIAMYSFTANSFTRGLDFGYSDLRYTLVHYGSLILFFGYSLSNFTLVRRYLAPIRVPIGFLFPKVKTVENFTGLKLMIRSSKSLRLRKKYGHLSQYFPLKGELIEQFVLDGNLNSYLFKANQEQYIINGLNDQFILVPKSNAKTLNSNKPVLIYLFVIPNENILKQTVVKPSDLIFAGWAVSSRLE